MYGYNTSNQYQPLFSARIIMFKIQKDQSTDGDDDYSAKT